VRSQKRRSTRPLSVRRMCLGQGMGAVTTIRPLSRVLTQRGVPGWRTILSVVPRARSFDGGGRSSLPCSVEGIYGTFLMMGWFDIRESPRRLGTMVTNAMTRGRRVRCNGTRVPALRGVRLNSMAEVGGESRYRPLRHIADYDEWYGCGSMKDLERCLDVFFNLTGTLC
jgi:hypothetical protein